MLFGVDLSVYIHEEMIQTEFRKTSYTLTKFKKVINVDEELKTEKIEKSKLLNIVFKNEFGFKEDKTINVL